MIEYKKVKMTLNEGQKNMVDELLKFYGDDDQYFFVVSGGGGTGKTFTLKSFLKQVGNNDEGDEFFFCSPTHKALNVLKQSILEKDNNGDVLHIPNSQFMTIARLLKYRQKTNAETGKKTFESEAVIKNEIVKKNGTKKITWAIKQVIYKELVDESINGEKKYEEKARGIFDNDNYFNKLIIIDECSMITSEQYEILKVFQKEVNCKIVFVGDPCQLPPIEEERKNKISKSFNQTMGVKLTKTMRTSDNNIYKIYNLFRECIYSNGGVKNYLIHLYKQGNLGNVLITTSKSKFLREIKNGLLKKKETFRILAYTNKVVEHYNNTVINFYNEDNVVKKKFKINDRVVTTDLLFTEEPLCSGTTKENPNKNSNFKLYDHWPCGKFFSNTDLIIDDIEEEEIYSDYFGKEFKTYKMGVYTEKKCPEHPEGFLEFNIRKIHEDDKKKFSKYKSKKKKKIEKEIKTLMNEREKKKLWNEFNKQVSLHNAPIRHAYSTTIHKSQGSTFDNVFIDVQDVLDARKFTSDFEIYRALYTAVSRSRKTLTLLFQIDKGDVSKEFEETFNRKCSRCHSKKIFKEFERPNGITKKTCNQCSITRKNKRLNKKV